MEKILIVDDAELNRDILSSIFEDQYETIGAMDGQEACFLIDKYGTDLSIIFLDLVMPNKNGFDVLSYLRQKNLIDYIPVIVITGETNEDYYIKAYEYGADDIIHKPFAARVVSRRAMNMIEQYKHRRQIEVELAKRNAEVIESQEYMTRMNEVLLDALGSVVEFRSLESGEHIKRVMRFTKIILDYINCCYPEYELNHSKIELMSQAAALHDVGKIAIPDEILKAPRKLTTEEFAEMKKHTTYGCEILTKFKIMDNDFFNYCYEICRWHHEKVDGKGYPDGLKGDQIPIYCQAASIADCFDALISKRVYKDAVDCNNAYNMIVNGECGAFSSIMLECFERVKLELFLAVEEINRGGTIA